MGQKNLPVKTHTFSGKICTASHLTFLLSTILFSTLWWDTYIWDIYFIFYINLLSQFYVNRLFKNFVTKSATAF